MTRIIDRKNIKILSNEKDNQIDCKLLYFYIELHSYSGGNKLKTIKILKVIPWNQIALLPLINNSEQKKT